MALKTDYKDDVFSGNRKYQMINNDDGTISLIDVTTYSQEGDTFGAPDINATNKAIQSEMLSTTIKADGWAEDGTYVIEDSRITATSKQEIWPDAGITKDQFTIFSSAMIVWDTQEEGKATIKALNKAPTVDVPVLIIFRGEK